MKVRILSLCLLGIMSTLFIFGVIGYFVFRSRVRSKKTAVKLKRHLKKNAMWWGLLWAAWMVIFFMRWNTARIVKNEYYLKNYEYIIAAGLILTAMLLLDLFFGKYAYITSQRVYFPDSFGFARHKKKVMYRLTGKNLKLWFNNGIIPKEFSVVEKHEELEKLLRDNYKLNKTV